MRLVEATSTERTSHNTETFGAVSTFTSGHLHTPVSQALLLNHSDVNKACADVSSSMKSHRSTQEARHVFREEEHVSENTPLAN